MNVSIVGRKVKITPDLREYIEKKMKKLDHFIDHIYDLAEVNIHMKKKVIHIFAKTSDVYSVVDMLYDKIEVKMMRYRNKLTHRRVIPLKETFAEPVAVGAGEENGDSREEL